MVKTWTADGTILETIWESRWLPEHTEKPYSDQGIYARGARGMDVLDDCMAVRERDVSLPRGSLDPRRVFLENRIQKLILKYPLF